MFLLKCIVFTYYEIYENKLLQTPNYQTGAYELYFLCYTLTNIKVMYLL